MQPCNKEDEITQIMIDVACIKQAIMGNGQPGLCKRIDTLESNYSNGIKVFSALGIIIGSAFTFFINLFKGWYNESRN